MINAILTDDSDPERYNRARPYCELLVRSDIEAEQAIGHLYLGVADLDRSGVGGTVVDARPRASALAHLKVAAAGLPEVATAQALYGVALILSGEPALGRQYLLVARRLPNLEPRYRLWCAWAMVQAGYLEEAEPDAPYGVKGVGEPPTVVSRAAIASALRDATGRALTRAPVSPDDIVALHDGS